MSRSDIVTANMSDLVKGGLGISSTIAAAITANMEHIEFGLRCLLHLTGIAVGLVTIWSIVRRSRGPH